MSALPTPITLEREAPPPRQHAHGVIHVGQTRASLESVISLLGQGAIAEEIALRYEVLDLHEIYATLSYFVDHR